VRSRAPPKKPPKAAKNHTEPLSVTVDVALLSVRDGGLFTLLFRAAARQDNREEEWSLPGGEVAHDEALDTAARRALARAASLREVFLEQLYTFGDPGRDSRRRAISVAYYALVDRRRFETVPSVAGTEEADVIVGRILVPWEGETGGPVDVVSAEKATPLMLSLDHADILGMAVRRIRGKLDWSPIGFQLLGETFTLLDLQRVHETVLGRPLNKDSFRRRMLASGQLEATGEMERGVDHRPAELYRFAKRSAV
jgi:8-oxo-dGTP diphosphatase